MAKDTRTHLTSVKDNTDDGSQEPYDLLPKEMTKQEFSRKLYHLIMDRGWNQSELARRSGVGRDAISTYVRGRSYPEPRTLNKISKALGIKPEELLPNQFANAVERDEPALSIQESPGHPEKCWLKVNRLVTADQALRIMQIIHETDKHAEPV